MIEPFAVYETLCRRKAFHDAAAEKAEQEKDLVNQLSHSVAAMITESLAEAIRENATMEKGEKFDER